MSSITGYISKQDFTPNYTAAKKHLFFQDYFKRIEQGTVCYTYPAHTPLQYNDALYTYVAIGYAFPEQFKNFCTAWPLHKENAIEKIDGNFLLCITEKKTGDIWLINDIYGSYPCFYVHNEQGFFFASTLFALKEFIPQRTLDKKAIAQLLYYGYNLGDTTFFEEAKALLQANCLHYSKEKNKVITKQYFEFDRPLNTTITFEEAATKAAAILQETVLTLQAGKTTAQSFLSGGLDARTIVAILHEHNIPVNTYTFNDVDENDIYCAKKIAKHLKGMHTTEYLDLDIFKNFGAETLLANDCAASSLMAPALYTVDKHKKEIKEIFDGYLGGPIFGVTILSDALLESKDEAAIFKFIRERNRAFPEEIVHPKFKNYFNEQQDNFVKSFIAQYYNKNDVRNLADIYNIITRQHRFFPAGLQRSRTRIDIMTPFASKKLYELTFSLPAKWHNVERPLHKAVLQKISKTISKCPTSKTRYIGVVTSKYMKKIEYFFFRLNNLRWKLGLFSKKDVFPEEKALARVKEQMVAEIIDQKETLGEFINYDFVPKMLERCDNDELAVLHQIAFITKVYF